MEYSETTESMPPNIAKADAESNQESQTEEPQVTYVNGRESNACVAVICDESSSQSVSLGRDPQPQPVATDTYTCRHRFQRRVPETSKYLYEEVIAYFGLVFVTNTTSDLSELLPIFHIFLSKL